MVTKITEPRFEFKTSEGFEYPKYFEAWEKCLTSVWNYKEVSMTEDVMNWKMASEIDRLIIGGILRAFTQAECVIGDNWSNFVWTLAPKPEIKMMCIAFSFFEGLHGTAYNHLSSTLGIDEYSAYMGDPIAQKKVEYLVNMSSSNKVRLAIFAGAAEGVALFSAFSILLSFCKESRFKGLSEIISWSIADEEAHSKMGSELFKDLVKEEGITEEEIEEIVEGFNLVLQNEFEFLNNVFGDVEKINNISKDCFFEFLKSRYNNRLECLGISPKYFLTVDTDLSFQVSSWFNLMSKGNISQDFFSFSKDGSQYVSKPVFDTSKVIWTNLDLK